MLSEKGLMQLCDCAYHTTVNSHLSSQKINMTTITKPTLMSEVKPDMKMVYFNSLESAEYALNYDSGTDIRYNLRTPSIQNEFDYSRDEIWEANFAFRNKYFRIRNLYKIIHDFFDATTMYCPQLGESFRGRAGKLLCQDKDKNLIYMTFSYSKTNTRLMELAKLIYDNDNFDKYHHGGDDAYSHMILDRGYYLMLEHKLPRSPLYAPLSFPDMTTATRRKIKKRIPSHAKFDREIQVPILSGMMYKIPTTGIDFKTLNQGRFK